MIQHWIKCEVLEDGRLPEKANMSDAGSDVFATSDIIIPPRGIIKHPLNIKLELPDNCYMEITSKSGNGSRGLLVYAGIIDEEYRGIVHVVAHNLTDQPLEFKKGHKLAQMIYHPYTKWTAFKQVDKVDPNTKRGAGGFGSTGK
jgi:dUTP pyrophosphatase